MQKVSKSSGISTSNFQLLISNFEDSRDDLRVVVAGDGKPD
jgi:hypothetical protein